MNSPIYKKNNSFVDDNFKWSEYCFDLNLNNGGLLKTSCEPIDDSIINYIKHLRRIYPELNMFKKVASIANFEEAYRILAYAKENNHLIREVVLDTSIFTNHNDNNPRFPYYCNFNIFNEKYAVIQSYNATYSIKEILLFFNDYDFIKNTFYKNDLKKYPPGIYELGIDPNGDYILNEININYFETPILDKKMTKALNNDIKGFFNEKSFYNKNNIPRKRGIILYGPSGCGKTTVIKNTLLKYPESYRVIIDCGAHFSHELFDFLERVFPRDKEKIIVFEDVESIGMDGNGQSYSKRSSFLNFIDGPKTLENTLFLATTNYPDLVDKALINRPSRFDKIYKINFPNMDCRKRHLKKWFPKLEDRELEKYGEQTANFSGASFKELFILVGIQKMTLDEAISSIKSQMKIIKKNNFDEGKPLGLIS